MVIFIGRVEIPSLHKWMKTFPRPIRSFPVKENLMGSPESEIFGFRQKKLTTFYIRRIYALVSNISFGFGMYKKSN